ncbi:MAG: OmpH family outer membrane protein [Bdellovibrionia bacterium]
MKNTLIAKSLFVSMMGLGLSGVCLAAEDLKIATVDMQKALQTVDLGKKAKSQLEKEFNTKKKSLQTEETAIKKMTEEFKKQSLVMSDEARAKKQGELQERIMKFQELTARSQSEIQQKERDLTQPIIGKLRSIITDTAKKKAYTVVLEKNENTVLYSLEKDDITGEIISTFDKQSKSDKNSNEST